MDQLDAATPEYEENLDNVDVRTANRIMAHPPEDHPADPQHEPLAHAGVAGSSSTGTSDGDPETVDGASTIMDRRAVRPRR